MQKKQIIQFAALLVLILALAGAYAAVRSYNTAQEEKKEQKEEDARITLTSFEPESVTSISCESGATAYSLSSGQDGWIEDSNSEMKLDQEKVEEFLKDAGSITAVQEIQPQDGEEYGFDPASAVITITTANGTSSLTFGMKNEMLGQYYLKTSESSRIYLVEESVYSIFDKTVEDFEAEEEDTETGTDIETGTDTETE